MERLEYCYECNKDVNPTIKTEKNKYTYRGKEFLVVEEVHYCPKCGNILINDNFDNDMYKIYDCYLKLFNLSFSSLIVALDGTAVPIIKLRTRNPHNILFLFFMNILLIYVLPPPFGRRLFVGNIYRK